MLYFSEEGLAQRAEGVNTAAPEHHLRPMYGHELFITPEILLSFLFSGPAYDFFACVSLHIPILPFPPALPSIPCTSQLFCPALSLPKSS